MPTPTPRYIKERYGSLPLSSITLNLETTQIYRLHRPLPLECPLKWYRIIFLLEPSWVKSKKILGIKVPYCVVRRSYKLSTSTSYVTLGIAESGFYAQIWIHDPFIRIHLFVKFPRVSVIFAAIYFSPTSLTRDKRLPQFSSISF